MRWKEHSNEIDSWLTKEKLANHEPIEQFNKSLIKLELLDHVSFMLVFHDIQLRTSHFLMFNFDFHLQSSYTNMSFNATFNETIKMENSMLNGQVFKQAQPKSRGFIRKNSRVESVLDVVKKGDGGEAMCIVKYNRIKRTAWVPYEKIKETEPQRLIQYFESRIDWPNKRN